MGYRSRLLRQGDQDKPEYRALPPFGQVPIFEEDGFVLFETGAIVLHVSERCEALLPKEPGARSPSRTARPMSLFGFFFVVPARGECIDCPRDAIRGIVFTAG